MSKRAGITSGNPQPPLSCADDGSAPLYASRTLLILDNGGYHIKAMLVRPGAPVRLVVVPNCVGAAAYAGRGLVGAQLHSLPHYHGFMVRRPTDRGYVVDGVLQAYVWEYVLQQLGVDDERAVELIVTVPFAAPKAVSSLLYVLAARHFHFAAITVVSGHFLALLSRTLRPQKAAHDASTAGMDIQSRKRSRTERAGEDNAPAATSLAARLTGTAVVVDVGFSATTIVPYVDGLPVCSSAVRLSVGGKLLTNRLKEHLSFAQVNVLEDGWLINHVRERCCYVASTCSDDAPSWRAQLVKRGHPAGSPSVPTVLYYLPTIPALLPLGCTEAELPSRVVLRAAPSPGAVEAPASSPSRRGTSAVTVDASSLQSLRLCQEAFLIPELLFCPGDVGVQEMGLVQAITHGIHERGLLQHLPLLRRSLLEKVWVFGGVSTTTGFLARLEAELQTARQPEVANGAATAAPADSVPQGADPLATDTEALPPPFTEALAGSAPTQHGADSGCTPIVSLAELTPLLGAYYLVVPPSPSGDGVDMELEDRRLAVQQLLHERARVALGESNRAAAEESLNTALLRLL